MQTQNGETGSREALSSAEKHDFTGEPDFNAPAKPIADFVTQADFPNCTLGQHVDIGGYAGVVVAIVKQSMKVRSPEGVTRGFNSYNLRKIYGPPPEPEPVIVSSTPAQDEPVKAAAPKREVIEEPNFDQPIVPIAELVNRPDFPKCAFGQHVDIGGYTGVVVELVNESLKVRSQQGTSRNYNGPGLRKIYGPAKDAKPGL